MTRPFTPHQLIFQLGIPLSILAGLVLLIQSSFFVAGDNPMALGITLDLLLTVPVVYLLLIRKSNIPKTTAVPVMLLGLLVGTYFLPVDSQIYLNLFKSWGLPLIELGVVTFVALKVYRTVRRYKANKGSSPDFFRTLTQTCREVLPAKIAIPFANEIALFYYGFLHWKKRPLQSHEFSCHKLSGTPLLLGVFIFIIGIETFAMHLLIAKWSDLAAWILSGLSIYTGFQIFGFARSLAKRPTTIQNNQLHLRYGIMGEVDIPLADIEQVECSRKLIPEDSAIVYLSPLGSFESHNVLLYLKKEHMLSGLYGAQKPFQVLALHLDDEKGFKGVVDDLLK